jgi:hypothetical protein
MKTLLNLMLLRSCSSSTSGAAMTDLEMQTTDEFGSWTF